MDFANDDQFKRWVKQACLNENQVALDSCSGCLLVYDRGYGKYTAIGIGQKIDTPKVNRHKPARSRPWVLTLKAAKELAAKILADQTGTFVDVICTNYDGPPTQHKVRAEGTRVAFYPDRNPHSSSTHLRRPGTSPRSVRAAAAKIARLTKALSDAKKAYGDILGPRLSTSSAVAFRYDLEQIEEHARAKREAAQKPKARKPARKKATKKKRAR